MCIFLGSWRHLRHSSEVFREGEIIQVNSKDRGQGKKNSRQKTGTSHTELQLMFSEPLWSPQEKHVIYKSVVTMSQNIQCGPIYMESQRSTGGGCSYAPVHSLLVPGTSSLALYPSFFLSLTLRVADQQPQCLPLGTPSCNKQLLLFGLFLHLLVGFWFLGWSLVIFYLWLNPHSLRHIQGQPPLPRPAGPTAWSKSHFWKALIYRPR